jgi:hypothetical protein
MRASFQVKIDGENQMMDLFAENMTIENSSVKMVQLDSENRSTF